MKRKKYTGQFKQQMVDLYNAGKPPYEIIEEYEISPSSFYKWVKQGNTSGSFKESDNKTKEQKELEELRKKKIKNYKCR